MRPFPSLSLVEQGSAAFSSEASANNEAVVSFWNMLVHFTQGLWIEVLVIPVALCILFWHARSGGKSPKTSNSGSQRQPVDRTSKKNFGNAAKYNAGSKVHGCDEGQQIQKFVITLLQRSHKSNPSGVLTQYRQLVKACRSNLREHITDDQNGRSMYLALIGCAVGATAENSGPGADAQQLTSNLLSDMKSMSFPRSIDFYASILRMFSNNQLIKECLWLHKQMVEDDLEPSNSMYISFLNAAVSSGEYKKAFAFFEEIAKTSAPSLRTIMTVLRVHSTLQDWQGAAKLLDRMDSLGTPPDNLILNNVLGLCVSAGEINGAEQLLQQWEHLADVISCNILLKGCSQQGNLTRAEVLLRRMTSKGPEPNLISYNTVMDCAVRNMQLLSESSGQYSGGSGRDAATNGVSLASRSVLAVARRPWDLLNELMGRGLEPDRYTCSTLVKGMHLAGSSIADIDRAVSLLHRIGPDALQAPQNGGSSVCNARLLEVLFNTLLDACISVRELDRMTQIFAMMQEFKVSVSAVTYGTLIKAFGQAGRLSRCHEIWKDMQVASIHPTIVTYGCYIDACIRNDSYDRAEEVFESMTKSPHGVRPNAVIYTSLIRGCAHAKQPRRALELYRRMQEDGIEATSVTFNSVLDIVARQVAEPSVLQEVIDDMCKASIVPDVVTYSILMKASCSSGNVQTALSLFRQIQSRGLVFDQVAFNTLLLACSKADQVADAEDIFEEMRRSGVAPTHVTTSIMVKMYGKAKMLDKAIALTDVLEKEYDQKPNLYVYTCLIQACVQNKHVRRSWDVFNKMISSGVEPDAVTYGTVIHGCVYLNKFSYAMSLVRHAYQRSHPSGMDSSSPFPVTIPLKHIVPLQQDVLQMLAAALQRKDEDGLCAELQEIMAENAVATKKSANYPRNSAKKGTGRGYMHRDV